MSQPYIVYDGEQFHYDGPKMDSVSIPVKCIECNDDIPLFEPSWRHWDRHLHIGCGCTSKKTSFRSES